MDITDIALFVLAGAAWSAVSLGIAVAVHELGHLIGGKLSGYRLSAIAMMGFLYDGKKVTRYDRKMLNAGQCFMSTGDYGRNPCFLILGGCAMNLAAGTAAALLAVLNAGPGSRKGLYLLMASAVAAAVNLAMGIWNLFLGSATSDGKTFLECRTDEHRSEYNRIMAVTGYLVGGLPFGLMPEELFSYGKDWKENSLSAEMRLYCYYRGTETAASAAEYRALAHEFGFDGDSWKKGRFFAAENELEHLIYGILFSGRTGCGSTDPAEPRTFLPGMFFAERVKAERPKGPDTSAMPLRGLAASYGAALENGIRIIRGGNKEK